MSKKPEKQEIDLAFLVMLEKASRLNVLTGFESNVLQDRIEAVQTYSMKAVVSKKQLKMISEMACRYDALKKDL
jgi:UDP-N-acetylglucosamine enolpyruvyl transferase